MIKNGLNRTIAAAEDYYSSARKWGRTDDGTDWSSADQSAERGVYFQSVEIEYSSWFLIFLPLNEKLSWILVFQFLGKMKKRSLFLFSILNIKLINEWYTDSK